MYTITVLMLIQLRCRGDRAINQSGSSAGDDITTLSVPVPAPSSEAETTGSDVTTGTAMAT